MIPMILGLQEITHTTHVLMSYWDPLFQVVNQSQLYGSSCSNNSML